MGADPEPLRVGIVGAGRTRQGLGPYLAAACEAAGARVVAVSGRDLLGARRAADGLQTGLGHAVAAAGDAAALARQVDALVVAAPAPAHADGLRAALAAGVPCLCEKPLLPFAEVGEAVALAQGFARRELLLLENCQWPEVLPALYALHPDLVGQPVRAVAMGLGPAAAGPAMIEDSLSHVLSVVQALVAVDAESAPRAVRQTAAGADAEHNVLTFELSGPGGPVAVTLQLDRCPQQPRPAWLSVNGRRIDRAIGAGYALSFVAQGRELAVADPLHSLVARFVSWCRDDVPAARRTAVAAVAARARLGGAILAALA